MSLALILAARRSICIYYVSPRINSWDKDVHMYSMPSSKFQVKAGGEELLGWWRQPLGLRYADRKEVVCHENWYYGARSPIYSTPYSNQPKQKQPPPKKRLTEKRKDYMLEVVCTKKTVRTNKSAGETVLLAPRGLLCTPHRIPIVELANTIGQARRLGQRN